MQPSQELQVLLPREVQVEMDLAGQITDPGLHLEPPAGDLEAEHTGRPGSGPQQSGEETQGGGLAGPVGAEEAVHPALGNGQLQAVHGNRGPEAFGEAPSSDDVDGALQPRSMLPARQGSTPQETRHERYRRDRQKR